MGNNERENNNPPKVYVHDVKITCYKNNMHFFNGTGWDIDGVIVLYQWDFDGDGNFDWNSTETGNTTHVYWELGNYNAIFRVTDNDGAVAEKIIEITVLEKLRLSMPELYIITPSDGDTIMGTLKFSGRCYVNHYTDETVDVYVYATISNNTVKLEFPTNLTTNDTYNYQWRFILNTTELYYGLYDLMIILRTSRWPDVIREIQIYIEN